MFDLECFSLRSDAAIVAIAVAISDDARPHEPYQAQGWFIDPNLTIGHIDPDTMDWWDRQDETVKRLVLRGNLNPVEALHGLNSFINANGCAGGTDKKPREDVLVYGDPAMYDLPVLDFMYKVCGIVKPWGYRQQQDARTIKKVITDIVGIQFWPAENPMPHHPVHDAITQLKDLNSLISLASELVHPAQVIT
jgi:hypothetical protein